jgi:hypothetical protein
VLLPAEQGGDDGPGAAGGEWTHLRAGGAGLAPSEAGTKSLDADCDGMRLRSG